MNENTETQKEANTQEPQPLGVNVERLVSDFWQPTLQTTFDEKGNCFSACIATMFPVGIDDVPFFETDEWHVDLQEWASEKLGVFFAHIKLPSMDDLAIAFNGSAIITAINSPNPKVERHAVITKGKNIIFDPMIGETKRSFTMVDDPTFILASAMRRV